jgi:hypothetical protein
MKFCHCRDQVTRRPGAHGMDAVMKEQEGTLQQDGHPGTGEAGSRVTGEACPERDIADIRRDVDQ